MGHLAPACLSSWNNASAAIPGRSGRRVVRRLGLQPGIAGAGGGGGWGGWRDWSVWGTSLHLHGLAGPSDF